MLRYVNNNHVASTEPLNKSPPFIEQTDKQVFLFVCILCAGTLESTRVLEQLSESSVIMHQIYKRVWPSSQRDTVFLSHIREIPSYDAGERQDNEVGRPWIVCNNSLDHPDAPV